MAFPIPLLLLGAAGLGGLYLFTRPDTAKPSKPSGAPGTPGAPSAQVNVVPAALRTAIDQLLSNPNVNPDDLDKMADELDKYGLASESAQLRMKATQLRASKPAPMPFPAPIPVPSVIKPLFPVEPIGPVEPIQPVEPITPVEPAPSPPPAPVAQAEYAIATSDVYTRSNPDSTSSVVSQEMWKGTRATVLQKDIQGKGGGGVWTHIQTPSGKQGYVAQMYLRFETAPVTSGTSVTRARSERFACCLSPTGCLLRHRPQPASNGLGVIPSGECVQVLGHVEGSKTSALAPGPGGYLHVAYQGKRGWAPAEWFQLR